ncbi:hypothetical protein DOW39_06120 [Salmonella enterica subsp. enterica serovar Tanger]|nr:hypothetical protein [Salmonella enterica subsp. enterica serovar Tanger]EBV4601239.1 hypothetical protein [Salmonella enterica subsp. enterica serovar Tanger]
MNDITALAVIAKIKEQTESFDTVVLKEVEAKALVEALEKSQRANAAQDDHINQQQARIDTLEKRNAELGKYAGELEARSVSIPEVRITVAESKRKNLTWRELGAYNEGADVAKEAIIAVLRAAGIGVKVE